MLIRSVLVCFLFIAGLANAQSTSTWIKLSTKTNSPTGALGASYLSVNFVAASVYQDSNWWTNLVEQNRSAVASVEVNGNLSGGKSFSDKRISPAIEIQRNKKNIDFGWAQTLVRDLPVSFTSMSIGVGIAKTSADGVEQLIGAATELSKKVPPLAASDATLGAVSAAKLLVDFIFDKQLAVAKLKSANPLTAPAGTTLEPGYYAVLAGTASDEYQNFLQPPSGGTGLSWDGAVLRYNGKPLQGLTYFVVEVAYKEHLYDPKNLPDAALTSERNWAKLYRSAIAEARQIADIKNIGDASRKIGQIKADAEQLLNEDADFVQAERTTIQSKVTESLNRIIKNRYNTLLAAEKDKLPFEVFSVRSNVRILLE